MTTVAQIIGHKAGEFHRLTAQTPVATALAEMAHAGEDGMVVMDGSALVGIFTSNDYLRKVVSAGLDAATLTVGDVMTRQVSVVAPGATTAQCVSMMSKGRFRHLPVVDDGRVVGMVAMIDIMGFSVHGADHDVGDAAS